MLTFAESGHLVFRSTSPLSRGGFKSKGKGKLSIHYCADLETIETFRTITSVNQLSLRGAVAEMCEEYKACHVRTGNPLWEGSRVLHSCSQRSSIATIRRTNWKVITTRQIEQICMDAGFPNIVEIGNTSWRKTLQNCHNSQMQWPVVSTLCQETKIHLNRKVGSEGTQKLGPYWKLQFVACKFNMELRSELCVWTKTILTRGSEFLMAQINWSRIWTTTIKKPQKCSSKNMRYDWMRVICKPIKGQSKTEPAGSSSKTIPIGERTWTDVEPGEYSISDYEVSKKLIHLLRHGSLLRENDGAIEFKRIKDNLEKHFLYCHHWFDDKWKKSMARGGENKKRYQYCTDSLGAIMYLRALQGHSWRSLIDPPLQDNVSIPNNFFEYIYHIGCAITSHSIINSGLIPGGQNLSNRLTVFFMLVDPMDKEHKDPDTIDLNETRHAQYMHKAWKKHQNAVYWVDINLALKKGLKFYQTRSNAIIPHETFPAYCIPKVVRMETGEIIYEKVYASPRPPPKISLNMIGWKNWVQKLLCKQKSPNQPNPNHYRTVRPVVTEQTSRSSARETRCLPWRNSRARCKKNVPFSGDRNTIFSWRNCETW